MEVLHFSRNRCAPGALRSWAMRRTTNHGANATMRVADWLSPTFYIMSGRLVVLLVLLVAVANPGHVLAATACPPAPVKPTAEMERAAMRNARDHGFLWRIRKDGRTSFLYGTIHIGKYEWLFPGPTVAQALRGSDTLAVEIDIMDPDIRARTSSGVKGLPTVALPESVARRMKKQALALCVPFDSIARLPPVFQVETLSLMEARREGLEADYAVDAMLAAVAHAARKNVVSLETPESQLAVLQSPDAKDTVALIEDDLDEMEQGVARDYLKRIARYWEDSDYASMSHFDTWCNCLDTETKRKFMKAILDDRNPALAERIDALHASGKQVFAAVGSLHMFGSLGLPALMEKRGYTVERVEWKPR